MVTITTRIAAPASNDPTLDFEAAWERERVAHEHATDLWREDEARAQQYGHCLISVSPKTSQAWRDAVAAWIYAVNLERREVAV